MKIKKTVMLSAFCLALGTSTALSQPASGGSGIYAPLAAAGDAAELWGGIVYSDTWGKYYQAGQPIPFGYYSFMTDGEGGFTPLYTDDQLLQPDGGAVLTGDTLHMMHDIYGYGSHILLYEAYDVRTWKLLTTKTLYDYSLSAFDLAQDPTTGLVYGEFSSSDSEEADFGTVDFNTLTKNVIAKMDTTFMGLAFTAEGQLYGVNRDGNLYKINKSTGEYTLVGPTGLSLDNYKQSAVIDQLTGRMYLTAQTTDGKAGLYLIDLQSGQAQLAWQYDDNQQITGLVIRQHGVTAASPSRVSDAKYAFENGSLSGKVTFTAPSTNRSGAAINGSLKALVVANGDTIATGSAQAGQTASINISVPSAGAYRMEVLTANADGLSEPQRTNIGWIGYDEPKISSTTFDLNSDTRVAKVTWSTPLSGIHGGYISKGELRFNVYRNPGEILVADHTADSTFTEALPDGEQQLYSYSIIPFNGSVAGDTATTEQKSLGSYVTVPYSETFDTRATVGEIWTDVDANNDGVVWTWADGRAVYNAGSNFGNDYLLSPQIQLSAGKVYKLSFTVHGGRGHRLQLKVGQGNDPTSRNDYKVAMKTQEFPNDNDTSVTQNIEVGADGLYRLAFRTTSDAHSENLQLDNILLAAGINNAAPDSVRALKVTPAEKGALKATVSFNAPTTSIDGNALSGALGANIYRGGKLIGTLSDIQPGSSASFVDNSPANGFNSYAVAAVSGEGEGLADSVRVYVGQDVPYAVQNVRLKDNLDGTSTLTWDAPKTMGKNGGYVDPDKLSYTIYQNDYDILPDTTLTTRSYTVGHRTQYDQSNYWYTVHVSNIAGEGDEASSNMLLEGAPFVPPFKESFAGGAAETVWWLDNDVNTAGFHLGHTTSADGDNGCIFWGATDDEKFGAAYSGMIDVSGTKRPVLSFWYYEVPGYNAKLSFTVSKNLAEDTEVWSHDFATATGNSGWKQAKVDLSAFKDASYIVLKIYAESQQTGYAVYVDDIEVNDVPDHALGISLQAPKSWTAGQPTNILANVANKGANDEATAVALYENNDEIANIQGINLAAGSDTSIVIPYTPSTAVASPVTLTANIVADASDDKVDNSATASIELRHSTLPSPTALSATGGAGTGSAVSLSWTAPVYSGEHIVTDGFEDYNPWIINGIGLWTTSDGDHLSSYGFQQQFPHSGSDFAFIVTNPTSIGADITADNLKGIAPHEGDQYITAFSAIGGQSSDWLTSPQLSGKAQEIEFYAKGISGQYDETFEVYADSTLLATVTADGNEWQNYSYLLPEGTKHFSIHYTSYDKFGLMIDDVTYSDGIITLTGYGIYRDGRLVATVPAGATTWEDDECHDGQSHSYSVTAIYNVGTSDPSIAASIVTGINGIVVDGNADNDNYYNVAGQKVDANSRGLVIKKGSKKVNK